MNTYRWFATLLALLAPLFGPGAAQADEKEPAPDTRSLNPFEECAAPSDHAAQRLARVLKALDYKGEDIALCRSILVPGIVAWTQLTGYEQHPFISYQKRPVVALLITYNPAFMQNMEAALPGRFLVDAVLAHQIGHHLKQHPQFENPRQGFNPPWEQEVEADYYAGYALARLKAKPADVQQVQLLLFALWDDPQHPQGRARIESLLAGWEAGGGEEIALQSLDALRSVTSKALRW